MEEMSSLSRKEPGCLTYEFYAALSSDTEFLLFQEWESIDALQDHFDTPHMETFLSELPDVLNGEIVTRRYEVRSRERGARQGVSQQAHQIVLRTLSARFPKLFTNLPALAFLY